MAKEYAGSLIGTGKRFAIVVSRFNEFITGRLLEGARDALGRHGVRPEDVDVAWVPGSCELPLVAQKLAGKGAYQAVICLGAVLRGQTPHFEFVAGQVARGISQVSLRSGVPVIFGVLTADSLEQAVERAGTKAGNRGADAARAALEMANLLEGM